MLFNSIAFSLYFLPIVLLLFYVLCKRNNPIVPIFLLIMGSLVFYGIWEPSGLFVLLGSILMNFVFVALLVGGKLTERQRFPILVIGISLNVTLLAYFKYTNFLLVNFSRLTGTWIEVDPVLLPLGISFFTFTQIALLVDSYRRDVKEVSFIRHLLFVSFFPHLIAGPIYHHKEMMPQFKRMVSAGLVPANMVLGIAIFVIGLVKKVLLADSVAPFANSVFNAAANGGHITFFEAWAGVLAFLFQIYFDFSGYTDMAIGLALMFNVRMPVNFNSPYKSTSIIDFWRRWHMTLSRFLTDYIYSPIALSLSRMALKAGAGRISFFIVSVIIPVNITFLISGIWHGAGWNFILFGVINGLALTVNYAWRQAKLPYLPWGLCWALTILTFAVSLIFFRAESLEASILVVKGVTGLNGFVLPAGYDVVLGKFGDFLKVLGWQFDDVVRAHLKPGQQAAWFTGLSLIIILLPNTQQLFARFKPVVDEDMMLVNRSPLEGISDRTIGLISRAHIIRIPSIVATMGGAFLAAAIGFMMIWQSLRENTLVEFIYFQF